MPAERVSMRRVREILRLKYECGATERAVARSIGIARSTVALTLERAAAATLSWPLPATLSDRMLEAMLYANAGALHGLRRKAEPDWTHIHRELRRPGVTLMLLWEEYRASAPDGYSYSRWCELYRGPAAPPGGGRERRLPCRPRSRPNPVPGLDRRPLDRRGAEPDHRRAGPCRQKLACLCPRPQGLP